MHTRSAATIRQDTGLRHRRKMSLVLTLAINIASSALSALPIFIMGKHYMREYPAQPRYRSL